MEGPRYSYEEKLGRSCLYINILFLYLYMVLSLNNKKQIWELIELLDNSVSDSLCSLLLNKQTNKDIHTIYNNIDMITLKSLDKVIGHKIEEICF